MDLTVKAYQLLAEWSQYRDLHYSARTQFDKALNIEIEKDALASLARQLNEVLMNDNQTELLFLVNTFELHFHLYRDQLIFEVLRTGIPERM